MPRRLGSGEIIRILEANGFAFVSQKGSHCKISQFFGLSGDCAASAKGNSDWHHALDHSPTGLAPADFAF
jgi:hypothetical protein